MLFVTNILAQFPELRLQNPPVALYAVQVACGAVVAWYPIEHTYKTMLPMELLLSTTD